MPDLPLLLLPAAAGVVCAALALTAARRRPGAPPTPVLDRPARDGGSSPQNATHGGTVIDWAADVVETWAGPPSATRAATMRLLHACKVVDVRQPAAAWAEQTALTRYAAWALASSAHRTQTRLIPDGVTVRDVRVAEAPDATLAELAAARMLQATIRGDRQAVVDVINTHAASASDPLSLAVAEARVGAIITEYACRVGEWIRSIPAAVAAHGDGTTSTSSRVCGCCDFDEGPR